MSKEETVYAKALEVYREELTDKNKKAMRKAADSLVKVRSQNRQREEDAGTRNPVPTLSTSATIHVPGEEG